MSVSRPCTACPHYTATDLCPHCGTLNAIQDACVDCGKPVDTLNSYDRCAWCWRQQEAHRVAPWPDDAIVRGFENVATHPLRNLGEHDLGDECA